MLLLTEISRPPSGQADHLSPFTFNQPQQKSPPVFKSVLLSHNAGVFLCPVKISLDNVPGLNFRKERTFALGGPKG